MDSLIKCRCGHSVVAHSASGCGGNRCGCPRSEHDILEAELSAARAEHVEMFRRYAEPERDTA